MYHDHHFGLRELPFKSLTSNTLFLGTAQLDALAKLNKALSEPSAVTLFVGEAGTGKTTLIHALLADLNDDNVRIVQLTNPTMSFEEMMGVMIQQIGIHPVGKGKLASHWALKTFLADPASTVKVVIIFDEAQRLSRETLEELRLLFDSRPPERNALQIVLVGRPELAQRFTDPKIRALNQLIGLRVLLRPLRGPEVRDYINCLLHAQDYEIFSRGALIEVASLSKGIPGKINELCHSALLLAYSDGSSAVEPQHVRDANMEIAYLREVSSGQDGTSAKARRGTLHRMTFNGKPLIAAWLSALAVAGALALEFGRASSGAWFALPAEVRQARAHLGGEFSKLLSAGAGQSDEEPQRKTQTAASLRSDQSPPGGGGPSKKASVAFAPEFVAPKGSAGNRGDTLIAPIAGFQPEEMPETLTATDSALPEPAAAPLPSDNRLANEQARRLRYELKRAQSSLGAGNYANAIYHLKRALRVDPGASVARDLLERARAAESNPAGSDESMASSPASSAAVAWPNYRLEMPAQAPSAIASAEVASPPVPAGETRRVSKGSGPPANDSGEITATPATAPTSRSASTGGAPAGRAVFNIQIQTAMDQQNANQMVHQLQQLGYHPRLVSTPIDGPTSYKVEIGPYASQNEARAAKDELRLKYNSAFDPPAPILGDDLPDLLRPFSPTPLRIGLSTEPFGN